MLALNINGMPINNLKYAKDIMLLEKNDHVLQAIMGHLNRSTAECDLDINV